MLTGAPKLLKSYGEAEENVGPCPPQDLHFGFGTHEAASRLTGTHSLLRTHCEFSGGRGSMSRLTGASSILRTCCEASRGCEASRRMFLLLPEEAYSTLRGDPEYSGPTDYDSGTRGAMSTFTGARLPQDPLEDSGGAVRGHVNVRRDSSEP